MQAPDPGIQISSLCGTPGGKVAIPAFGGREVLQCWLLASELVLGFRNYSSHSTSLPSYHDALPVAPATSAAATLPDSWEQGIRAPNTG